jgi:hypothetical protein
MRQKKWPDEAGHLEVLLLRLSTEPEPELEPQELARPRRGQVPLDQLAPQAR